jgi:hypothetical protein
MTKEARRVKVYMIDVFGISLMGKEVIPFQSLLYERILDEIK